MAQSPSSSFLFLVINSVSAFLRRDEQSVCVGVSALCTIAAFFSGCQKAEFNRHSYQCAKVQCENIRIRLALARLKRYSCSFGKERHHSSDGIRLESSRQYGIILPNIGRCVSDSGRCEDASQSLILISEARQLHRSKRIVQCQRILFSAENTHQHGLQQGSRGVIIVKKIDFDHHAVTAS